jgi:hypothetical protein
MYNNTITQRQRSDESQEMNTRISRGGSVTDCSTTDSRLPNQNVEAGFLQMYNNTITEG